MHPFFAIARRRLTYFLAVSLPMRLHFAVDSARYAVGCQEECLAHYGDGSPTTLEDLVAWMKGFFEGLTRRQIPQWFVERWFAPQSATTARPSLPSGTSQR